MKKLLFLILTSLTVTFVCAQNHANSRASKAQWTVYQQIAAQATDHAAFDALLYQAAQATTDEEIQDYDSQLWTALKQLITTGNTKTGQFDLTALLGNTDIQEFSDTKTGNVTYTLKDLPAGQYTVKVQAFHRPAEYLTANALYEMGKDAR